jgi:hypothetical protein
LPAGRDPSHHRGAHPLAEGALPRRASTLLVTLGAAALGPQAAAPGAHLGDRTLGDGPVRRPCTPSDTVQTLGRVILDEVRARQGRADDAGLLLDEVTAMALGPGLSPWASC